MVGFWSHIIQQGTFTYAYNKTPGYNSIDLIDCFRLLKTFDKREASMVWYAFLTNHPVAIINPKITDPLGLVNYRVGIVYTHSCPDRTMCEFLARVDLKGEPRDQYVSRHLFCIKNDHSSLFLKEKPPLWLERVVVREKIDSQLILEFKDNFTRIKANEYPKMTLTEINPNDLLKHKRIEK